MRALKKGTDALNAIHNEMSLDEMESIIADSSEAIEVRMISC